jgi:hypothetical protein
MLRGISGDPIEDVPDGAPVDVPPLISHQRSHGHIMPPQGMGHGVGLGVGVVVDAGGVWGGVQVWLPKANVPSAFCSQVQVVLAVGAIIPIASPICSYRTY